MGIGELKIIDHEICFINSVSAFVSSSMTMSNPVIILSISGLLSFCFFDGHHKRVARAYNLFILPCDLPHRNTSIAQPLKKEGFVTRDPRAKERKKPGLKRARKAPQYTKR